MELTLQIAEARLLRRILTQYLSDLRMEITDTENFDWRQDLKRDEESIKSLLTRIEAIEHAPAALLDEGPQG
jgi:hypothetical protein